MVTARRMSSVMEYFRHDLEDAGWEVVVVLPDGQYFDDQSLAKVCSGATAAIIGDDVANRNFFERVPTLEVLVKWGVGIDSVDKVAAEESGVFFRNTPAVFGAEVADLAMAYVLSLARNLFPVHQGVIAGLWPQPIGISLEGRTIGILGFGNIGRQLAHRAEAFGMGILFFDPFVEKEEGVLWRKAESVDTIFMEADFLVLTAPSTEMTRGIVGREHISLMKPSSFLVNVSRGDLVVESNLAEALRAGTIAGAALDVFEEEPLPLDAGLRQSPNIIFGSHNASNTIEGLVRASQVATDIVIGWSRNNQNKNVPQS